MSLQARLLGGYDREPPPPSDEAAAGTPPLRAVRPPPASRAAAAAVAAASTPAAPASAGDVGTQLSQLVASALRTHTNSSDANPPAAADGAAAADDGGDDAAAAVCVYTHPAVLAAVPRHSALSATLNVNYRSHPALLRVPSALYYGGTLVSHADPAITSAALGWSLLSRLPSAGGAAGAPPPPPPAAEAPPALGFPLLAVGVAGRDRLEQGSHSWVNDDEVSSERPRPGREVGATSYAAHIARAPAHRLSRLPTTPPSSLPHLP